MTLALYGKSRRRQLTLLALALFAVFAAMGGALSTFGPASAARNPVSATVGGGSSVIVGPGASVSVSFTVNITDTSDWNGTSWGFDGGLGNCSNTPDNNTNGNHTETFNITAPNTAGTYDLTLHARSNGGCTQGTTGGPFTLVDAITVVPNYENVSATVNGAAQATVAQGATVSVVFTVTLNNEANAAWDSTQWDFDDATPDNCANTNNSSANGTQSRTFDVTAPNTPGTYDLMLRASSSGSNCNNNSGPVFTLVDALIVQAPQLPAPQVPNLALPDQCTAPNIHFVIDLSGSVAPSVGAMMGSLNTLIGNIETAFPNANWAYTTFRYNNGLILGGASWAATLSLPTSPTTGTYTPTAGGIQSAVAGGTGPGGQPAIMVIVTDGDPNVPLGGAPTNYFTGSSNAITQADAARTAGFRTVSISFGPGDDSSTVDSAVVLAGLAGSDWVPGALTNNISVAQASDLGAALQGALESACAVDLNISKNTPDADIAPGDVATYNVVVTNSATSASPASTITDNLPGTGVLNWSENSASCSIGGVFPAAQTMTCNVPSLAANGGQFTVQLTATVPAFTANPNLCGPIINMATLNWTEGQTPMTDESEQVTINVTCPTTGQLTIVKYVWNGEAWVIPATPTDYDFLADGVTNYIYDGPGTKVVNADTYTVTETDMPAGTHLVGLYAAASDTACLSAPPNGTAADPAAQSINVVVTAASHKYVCAFDAPNPPDTGTLTIKKMLWDGDSYVPDNGEWGFRYTAGGGNDYDSATPVATNAVTTLPLLSSPTVYEFIPTGSSVTGLSVVDARDGECPVAPQLGLDWDGPDTFTAIGFVALTVAIPDRTFCWYNTELETTITIEKYVLVNGIYVPTTSTDFDFLADGATDYEFDGPGTQPVLPGTYDVGEHDPSGAGYELVAIFQAVETCPEQPFTPDAIVLDGDSTEVNVAPGQSLVVCAYNAPVGRLIINKVNNSNDPGPFTFDINDEGGDFDTAVGGNGEVFNEIVPLGTYTVAELGVGTFAQCPTTPGVAGIFQLNPTPVQTIDEPGETITFTITNDDCPVLLGTGDLTVRKFLDMDGTPGPEDSLINWTVTVTGPDFPGGQDFDLDGANPNSPSVGVLFLPGIGVGPYTITEALPTDYVQTGLIVNGTPQGVNVTAGVVIQLDESDAVDFYNQPTGDLRVEKTTFRNGVAVDDRGGWTITVSGCGYFNVAVTNAAGVATFDNIPICNNVTVQEDPNSKPNYVASGGAVRVIAITAGNTVTVTFRNDRNDPCVGNCGPSTTPTNTPTNTPTATPTDGTTPDDPTVEPTDDVAGEITPGPTDDSGAAATPIAPSAGSGTAGATSAIAMMLVVLGLFAISSGATVLAVARRRN